MLNFILQNSIWIYSNTVYDSSKGFFQCHTKFLNIFLEIYLIANMALLQIFKKPELAKDKGYAWLILFFSFLSHFAHIGFLSGTAGNLTIAHQKVFNIDLQKGSLLGTIHIGVLLLFGPIASVLIKKFGCRATQILGGACILIGIALSALSRQMWHAVILYSVLAGTL
ncbi:hypothetical protein EB796_000733 [Bugula neritina]|uniref:Uncharacterized protein n=1 Tax=Bugula neritina TaxID=10212 RepID=A0A7J7KS41_BUGNE|nr:hypothetical protein EB796_000733 [Bugula neritina]